MQPTALFHVDGAISFNNTPWHVGTLVFHGSPDCLTVLLEIYRHVDMHGAAFSHTFTPGQLRNVPPKRSSTPRSFLFFTFEGNIVIKIESAWENLAALGRFLNNMRDDAMRNDSYSRSPNFHGTPPYLTYSQKQLAASRRYSYSPRHGSVVKSPSGHRTSLSPNKRFRSPRDHHDSDSLHIIKEGSSGFSTRRFFGNSNSRNYGGENRPPLKSLNTNCNQDHSKRPKQLLFDSTKSPKLSYDSCSNINKDGAQLGGQAKVKEPRSHKPFDLTSADNNNRESSPYSGFPNIGNSCFMNSVLQSLLQLRCVADDMETVRQSLEQNLPEQSIIKYLLALLSCPPDECQMLLGQTLEVVCNSSPCFADGQQHDALEFLVQLLDVIKEEVKKASKGDSSDPVTNNIEFQVLSSYMCQKCERVLSKKEVLNMLSLNVPNADTGEPSSLVDALKLYFEPQDIEMKCEHCPGTSTRCIQAFSTFPRVLVFHLKRYTYVDGTCKILCPVQVPIHLSLEEFVTDPNRPEQLKKSHPPSPVSTEEVKETPDSFPLATSIEDEKLVPLSPIRIPPGTNSEHSNEDLISNSPTTTRMPTSENSNEDAFAISPTRTPKSENSSEIEKRNSSTPIPQRSKKTSSLKCTTPARKSLNNLHSSSPKVPIVLKGGSDSASIASPVPAVGSDVPVDKGEDNLMETIAEETEDEQFEKVLKLSRESLENQEDKELIEAMNRSVQETCMPTDFLEETEMTHDEILSEDAENTSGPWSYQLASVVSHIGHNADTGHYVANVFDSQVNQWWHFNDEVVHRKSKHSVFESIKTQGYLFFYVARNP